MFISHNDDDGVGVYYFSQNTKQNDDCFDVFLAHKNNRKFYLSSCLDINTQHITFQLLNEKLFDPNDNGA